MRRFQKGKLYRLTEEWANYYDPDSLGYRFAIPVQSGDFYACDCRIVNKNRKPHPGYANSPVPLNYQAVILVDQ